MHSGCHIVVIPEKCILLWPTIKRLSSWSEFCQYLLGWYPVYFRFSPTTFINLTVQNTKPSVNCSFPKSSRKCSSSYSMPTIPDTPVLLYWQSLQALRKTRAKALPILPPLQGKGGRGGAGKRHHMEQYLLELYPPSVKLVLCFLEIKIAALSASQLAFFGNWFFPLLFGFDIIEHPFAFGCGYLRVHSSRKQYNMQVTHKIKVCVLDI